MSVTLLAEFFARPNVVNTNPAKMAMIAITTNNSTKVNPRMHLVRLGIACVIFVKRFSFGKDRGNLHQQKGWNFIEASGNPGVERACSPGVTS